MFDPKKNRVAMFGLATMAVLGLGSFALIFQTFSARLRAPFHLLPPRDINSFSISTDFDEQIAAQTKDTDQDGIPDAQELQVYKTSPFLEDSDSDGILDKEEIAKGTDPNCPEGVDCRNNYFADARTTEQERVVKGLYESTVSAKIAETGIPGLTDATAIRGFLKQAGIADEVINKFSDAELRGIFEEAAKQSPISSGDHNPSQPPLTLRGGESGGGESGGELPKNPTPAEIRDLLLKTGVEKEMLAKFTDAQLIQLYQDTLKDFNK